MTYRLPVSILLSLSALIFEAGCSRAAISEEPVTVDELAIIVTAPSREVAFTNKEAGFFYTETNGEHRSSWQGWNVMAKEILEDYQIIDGIKPLRKSDATHTIVYPHQLVRSYHSGVKEAFTLLDTLDAFVVQVENLGDPQFLVRPLFRDSNRPEEFLTKFQDGVLLVAHRRHLKRTPDDNSPVWIGITIRSDDQQTQFVERSDTVGADFSPAALEARSASKAATVVFVADDTEEKTVALAHLVSANYRHLIDQRRLRMEELLNRSFVRTENERFDKAFHWALLSMDALVMNQGRKGIFAGLPWFDNYWGRDSFISLPGATLATGDFGDAKDILSSFARWQEQNPRSPDFGRIPNLVTPGSIAYNTTDGTPRFVTALEQYFRYSGDSVFVRSVYPIVKRSIEGALSSHVDRFGFLKHGDAETWMDAAGSNGAWSPRGDRANDVQALWYQQLKSGVVLADLAHDSQNAQLWEKIATAVRSNFNKYYPDSSGVGVADHLNPDGSQDHQFRPNQLFTISILDNAELRLQLFKTITDRLVYPYGVASLWQQDDDFHPYHHHEPLYVQDAAYHNGIVWTWLAGAWTDLAVSYQQADLAFEVTENMESQILDRGAVGTLSELLDAVPHPGEKTPRLSGAFSQAWSLAEFIRVFYQDYLGIRVDAPGKRLALSPRLPGSMQDRKSVV
jgi:predicted glycogen debranching enzyme